MSADLVFGIKIMAAVVFLIMPYLFGLVPFYSIKNLIKSETDAMRRKNSFWLSVANCFTAGVFYSIGIIHLLREGSEDLSQLGNDHHLPMAQILFIFGFFLIFFLEHVLFSHSHIHSHNSSTLPSSGYNSSSSLYNSNGNGAISNVKYGSIGSENPSLLSDYTNNQPIYQPEEKRQSLISIILTIVLSSHSIIGGMMVGSSVNLKATVAIMLAILFHKPLECLSLSISLSKTLPKIPKIKTSEGTPRPEEQIKIAQAIADGLPDPDSDLEQGSPDFISSESKNSNSKSTGSTSSPSMSSHLLSHSVPKLKLKESFSGKKLLSTTPRTFASNSGMIYVENDFKAFFRQGVVCIFVYSLMEPFGVMIGLFLGIWLKGNALTISTGILNSLGAGTFIYIATIDILAAEFISCEDGVSKRWKFFSCMFGLILSSTLIIVFDFD